jgi:hypothetical protein
VTKQGPLYSKGQIQQKQRKQKETPQHKAKEKTNKR